MKFSKKFSGGVCDKLDPFFLVRASLLTVSLIIALLIIASTATSTNSSTK